MRPCPPRPLACHYSETATMTRSRTVSHGRAGTAGRPSRSASRRSHALWYQLTRARCGWSVPSRAR